MKAQDELVDEVSYAEGVVNDAPEENVMNQFSDDSIDDDELLTAGLEDEESDDKSVAKDKIHEIDGEFKECVESAIVDDDDFADYEDLRSD